MRHSPAMAARAFALASDLDESLYRRMPAYQPLVEANMGGYPASTIHGGGRTSGVSDPTGRQAVNPKSDPARYDLAAVQADLVAAVRTLRQLDQALSATLDIEPVAAVAYRRITTVAGAQATLDSVGYLIDHLRHAWPAYHRAVAHLPLDLAASYGDLDSALGYLGSANDTIDRWLEPDPVRVHCANALGCPDRNPPALGERWCWACGQWRRRHDGEERTRAAEKAQDGMPPCGDHVAEPVLSIEGAA